MQPIRDAFGPLLAAVTTSPSAGAGLELWPLMTGLLGGLALFLYGMDKMAAALKAVAGERMRGILETLTGNRLVGALTGAFVTAVIQSSSVTTVMVVGFVTAGLMSLAQSIGIIMGANVGTTITAQIIAFRVTEFSLVLVAAGFAASTLGRRESLRQYGQGALALGLVFLGMSVMGEAMAPLRSHQPFLDAMTHMASPALGILIGALFTALVQSSSATTGVVIVMASQGLIPLPAGIALILGSNIGTCVTALLAAIGKPREALRASLVHVFFNVTGVLIWLPFLNPLAELATYLSPVSPALEGSARLAAEAPWQIANAHTVFNVANTVLLLGFSSWFARLVEWLAPDRPLEEDQLTRARYLDDELLSTPALALDRVRLEILHQGDHVQEMLGAILPALLTGDRESLHAVAAMDDRIDALHSQIVTYLGKVSQVPLTEAQSREFFKLMEAVNGLENIGDIIETNLVGLGLERVEHRVVVSKATAQVLTEFHQAVERAVSAAVQAVTQKSSAAAQQVLDMKQEINRMEASAGVHQAERLVAEEPNRLEAFRIETDTLQNQKRIFYFAKRMAWAAVPADAPGGNG